MRSGGSSDCSPCALCCCCKTAVSGGTRGALTAHHGDTALWGGGGWGSRGMGLGLALGMMLSCGCWGSSQPRMAAWWDLCRSPICSTAHNGRWAVGDEQWEMRGG